MTAGEVRTWTDYYFPTFGLTDVTAASEFGALQIVPSPASSPNELTARAFLTTPGQSIEVTLAVDAAPIFSEQMVVPADGTVSVAAQSTELSSGMAASAEFRMGDTVLVAGQIDL